MKQLALYWCLLALVAAFVCYLVRLGRERSEIVAPRPRERNPLYIICGTCSSDSRTPRKTVATRDGRCEVCGEASYTLASRFFAGGTFAETRAKVQGMLAD
jgi:hypothetical protein